MLLPTALLLSLAVGPAPEPPSLTGKWVLRQVLSVGMNVPFVGEAVSNTRAVIVFDLVQKDDHLQGEGSVCSLRIVSRPGLVRPVLPETFRRTVEQQSFSARLVEGPQGLRLVGERQLAVLGADLDDAEKSPLPTGPDHPAAHDTDEDGKPGMTMHVEGLFDVEIYLAQRQWSRLEGHQVSSRRFEGRVFHGAEQVLLGSDSVLVQSLPSMGPRPGASRFVLERVGPRTGCAELAEKD